MKGDTQQNWKLSRMPSKYLIFFACLIIAGCETPIRDPDVLPFKKNAIVSYGKNGMSIHDALEPLCDVKIRNTSPNKSKLGIVIMGGYDFNYKYNDPRASDAVLHVARTFSTALQEEIKRCATNVSIIINSDKSTPTRSLLSKSLSDNKKDGLIQISVQPEATRKGSALFISANYFRIKWEGGAEGESATTEAGLSRKYQIDPNIPLVAYARKFAETLYDNGTIGY